MTTPVAIFIASILIGVLCALVVQRNEDIENKKREKQFDDLIKELEDVVTEFKNDYEPKEK